MPWKACHVMAERLRFVARRLEGETMTPLQNGVRKCAARAGFQVLLEPNGFSFAWEFHGDNKRPGAVRDGVAAGTMVVPVEALAHSLVMPT